MFSQQSQRYVEIKEDYKLLGDDGITTNESNYLERTDLIEILDKYFIWNHNNYAEFHALLQSLYCYLYQVQEMGVKPEDARQVLPNATRTNITMSINLREDERLASLLVPSCEVHGFCTEHQCCNRKPKLEEVLEGYERYKDLNK